MAHGLRRKGVLRGERGLAGKGISKGWVSPVTPPERNKLKELVQVGNEMKYSENLERSFFFFYFVWDFFKVCLQRSGCL